MNLQEKLQQAEALLKEVKEEMQKKEAKSWPQNGDTCWIYSVQGAFAYVFESSIADSYNLNMGRAFQTKEQCEADFEARKVIYELKQQPGVVKFTAGTPQWTIRLDAKALQVFPDDWHSYCSLQDPVWFESEAAAKAAIATVGEDRILKAARWWSMGEV